MLDLAMPSSQRLPILRKTDAEFPDYSGQDLPDSLLSGNVRPD